MSDTRLSAVCRSQHGMPHQTSRCTGCGCACHHRRAPEDFRAQAEAARAGRLDDYLAARRAERRAARTGGDQR